jgi:dTDP-4-amino-4,6-dideoxygalactose transaminase
MGNNQFMEILLNDFQALWSDIEDEALNAFKRVGRSGWLILGNEVGSFEKQISKFTGIKHSIGCANGLDALEIALRVLNVGPGQKVLTTPLTAYATTLAIQKVGAEPCYVDVDTYGLLDLAKAEKVLEEDASVRTLLPVHLFGHALNLTRLSKLKARFEVNVIEDCAQALGARSDGQNVGSIGDLAGVSLYPTKNLGCLGDGGIVLCQSDVYATAAKSIRDYGQSTKYIHDRVGLNSRLDEVHAAILNEALLPRLETFTSKRRETAKAYNSAILNKALTLPGSPDASESVWHLFPVLVNGDRASFQAHLKANHIQSAIHYPYLVTQQKALTEYSKFKVYGELERANYFASHEISLPIHPYLRDEEIAKVIDACNSWKGSH